MKPLFILLICLLGMCGRGLAQTDSSVYNQLVFENMEGEKLAASDFKDSLPLLIIYFRPDCEECRADLAKIRMRYLHYPCEIWLVSFANKNELEALYDMSGLRPLENVEILRDDQDLMHKNFQFQFLPFAVLFDRSGNLVAKYSELPEWQQVESDLK